MFGGINVARKTTTFATLTLNLNTPIRNDIPERNIRLDINRVPTELNEGLARAQFVCASNIWRPVPDGLVLGSPDACILGADSRRVDIVTASKLANLNNRLSKKKVLTVLQSGPNKRYRARPGQQSW